MMHSPISRLLLVTVALAGLSACSPVGIVAGAGATVGLAAANERGVEGTFSDARIQAEINDLWFKYDLKTFAKLELNVNQGTVLVTGIVQDPEDRVEAIRLAWQPKGVKRVINEVRIEKGEGFTGYMRDKYIASRLRAAITVDKQIYSINYSIEVVASRVYLMGIAQSQAELNRVIEHARSVAYVKEVISYVRVLSGKAAPTAPQGPAQTGLRADEQTVTIQPAPSAPAVTTGTVTAEPL